MGRACAAVDDALLPGANASGRVLGEVVRGNTLHLFTTSEELVESRPLSGASIDSLVDCTQFLT